MATPQECAQKQHSVLLYMALQRLPGLGPQREARLFTHFPTLDALLSADINDWHRARLTAETITGLLEIRHNRERSRWALEAQPDYEICRERDWQLISQECAEYPAYLKQVAKPPPLLFVWGNVANLSAPLIAMVGSRKASRAGLEAARLIATQLVAQGKIVCSGMALGVDTACHQAALAAGGKTVAVLGSGLAKLYPARNESLAHAIAAQGCVVSEFPPNTGPHAGNFPQRNRIISGLSQAVVVVEAAKRSGSLITARFALEQNREVFAVPGSINNPQSSGCNELIKQGASLLTSAEDLLAELGPEIRAKESIETTKQTADDDAETIQLAQVLFAVGFEPTSMELIIDSTEHNAAQVSAALLQLQLLGRVEQRGAMYARIR
ncbi:MAG: DNA-processing protein DprA [Pseudomonadales bacterium]